MPDSIFLIDLKTKMPTPVVPVSFGEIDVKERSDLEEWVVSHPELLGEPLLVVTSEFFRFSTSNKRLDVLALDRAGILVIVELKLDAAGSHADLQGIRYAAFCSTMTMPQVVKEYAVWWETDEATAEKSILEFLGVDELPELGDRPRVILGAGSIDDQEITSCVLWLRRFGVDISCIELTPYRLPDSSIILVPRTIIPLPETREYTVSVERKEVAKIAKSSSTDEYSDLWSAVKATFNSLDCPLKVGMNSDQSWLVVRGGGDDAHYGWWRLKRRKAIWIGIGFRSKDAKLNDERLNLFRQAVPEAAKRAALDFVVDEEWGEATRRIGLVLPYDGSQPLGDVVEKSAHSMATLIERTLPILSEHGLR